MGVNEMKTIANLIARAVKNEDESKFAGLKAEVHALTAQFPIYQA
jgi:glycine hydroxymethyltransferase